MKRRVITDLLSTSIDSFVKEKGLQMSFYDVTLLDNSQLLYPHVDGGELQFPLRITDEAMRKFEVASPKIPLLSQHTRNSNPFDYDAKDVIGTVENIKFKNKKIKGDIFLIPDSEIAEHVASLIAKKVMHGVSVEMTPTFEFDSRNQEYIVTHLKLYSVSLVSNPACKKCFI
jgi:hypothetical protein